MMPRMFKLVVVSALLASACGGSRVTTGRPSMRRESAPLGRLDFAITGSADCQRLARDGWLALHSFEYERAEESFHAALAADARCAMAAWGAAMSHDHPIWHQRDVAKGRAELAKVTDESQLSDKERAFLAAARALYAIDNERAAHVAWLAAAVDMAHRFPDDDEVKLHHVLALLSVYGYDPQHVREQMEAGAIVLDVLARKPEHPGAVHYTIHAFDSREHAILALPAARTYARIAPAAGHAVHMPSHTFAHLGMWEDMVASNERAYAASVEWSKSRGESVSMHDWHAYSWLVAALIERGQLARAKQLVLEARAQLVATTDDNASMRRYLAEMVAAYVSATERWAEVDDLIAPVFAPSLGEGSDGAGVCANHAPGGGGEARPPLVLMARVRAETLRGEAALARGDRAQAEQSVAALTRIVGQMAPWAGSTAPRFKEQYEATIQALAARARLGAKPTNDAVAAAIEAIERLERAELAVGIAGPAFGKSPKQVHAELLMALGRPAEALVKYEQDLELRPRRAVALLGAARAAKAAGNAAKASQLYAALIDVWREADASLDALAEVRAAAR
jgi:tetratricopeptide (TPR) repeat protein